MASFSRQDVLRALEQDWGRYIDRFDRLPAGERQAFLDRQGYRQLKDLLGHVIAWWQDGLPRLRAWLSDPLQCQPDYDVNAFNAKAVERFADTGEDAVRLEFEKTRAEMIELVQSMPDSALEEENIAGRLYAETIGHYGEHAL